MRKLQKNRSKRVIILLLMVIFIAVNFVYVHADAELDLIKQIITENYYKEIDPWILRSNTPEELFGKLDEHSTYLNKKEFDIFTRSLDNSIVGIGAVLQKNLKEEVEIVEVLKNTPAEKNGLKKGAILLEVDHKETKTLKLNEVVKLIRGEPGSVITLKLLEAGEKAPVIKEIQRDIFHVDPVEYKIINKNIGYIKLHTFNKGMAQDVKKALSYFQANKIERIIIDLRGNGGGYLEEAIELARLFVNRAPVVHIQTKKETTTYASFLAQSPFKKENLVVLVDNYSASASEVFAAAIQDNQAGYIVGENTVGKGTVQKIYFLPSGAGFKLTEAVYLSPNKIEIEGKGIDPDYVVLRFSKDIFLEGFKDISLDRRLKAKDTGEDVMAIQQRLIAMGYKITDELGDFGDSTKMAVRKFQQDNNLYGYGIADFSTQKRLATAFADWLYEEKQDFQLQKAIELVN
ncbi:MAG: S41 family peptidase [Thermotaleaceae bacterium]